VCDFETAHCSSPAWLDCAEPAHRLVPAAEAGPSPAGQLRYLVDSGYQGDIYDAHTHLFAIPSTSGLPDLSDPDKYRFLARPMSIAKHYQLHRFYGGEHLRLRGFINLALPNMAGLGEPTSSYQYDGNSYLMAYTPAVAGDTADDDNYLAFAGNTMSAAALYTKQASFEPATDSYHSFAHAGLDWAEIRSGILDKTISSMADVKSRLSAQIYRMRDIGFDGLKLVNEWTAGRNGKWGAARPLVGLESLTDEEDPWALTGEMFNGNGGIFATAAKLGMSATVHGPDSQNNAEPYWQSGGVWDQVLSAHKGLRLTIAHGFALIKIHSGKPHFDQDPDRCDAVVEMMSKLFDEHDGKSGRSALRVDMLGAFINWWVEHNRLFQDDPGSVSHDYRAAFIKYQRHFVLGLDAVNSAARAFQSEACGAAHNPLETSLLSARIALEGPWQGNVRNLDLVGEPGVLSHIYRDNIFELAAVGTSPEHRGPAGVDTNGVRRIDCSLAAQHLSALRGSVRSEQRGLAPNADPLRRSLQEIAELLSSSCQG